MILNINNTFLVLSILLINPFQTINYFAFIKLIFCITFVYLLITRKLI